jgi:tetratricopeptide (TPR) repeat protein
LYDFAHASLNAFEAPAAFAAAGDALEAAVAAGDRSLEWLARIDRGSAQLLSDPHARSTEELREELTDALEAFEALGDELGLAETWTALADLEWLPCRFDTASGHAVRAAIHARKSGDRRLLQRALVMKTAGEMLGSTPPDAARESLEAMIEEVGDEGLLGHVAAVHEAMFTAYAGDFDRARRLSDQAIEIGERLGVNFYIAASSGFRGEIESLAGDPATAERFTRREYSVLESLADEGHLSTSAANLAMILCDLGRLDEAELLADAGMDLAAEDDLASQAVGRTALSLVRSARGRHDEAIRLAREAVEMLAEAESPNQRGHAWITLARALRVADREPEAMEAAEAALTFFELKGIRPAADSVRAFLHGSIG